ncbi:HAD family hydrolase [Rhodococcus sp. ABRD24]|uniref:HAD family hydrolase n=1 Tax=Rhodococcus sp. ABRD24 TaxID=2507582 RepID=UPI00103D89A9|nr:HAD family hydrolase [Rhodococcus sp. ABRD24]QBJ98211.1 HAD family hydrolase [Rhodococcus sp. ABRD24]
MIKTLLVDAGGVLFNNILEETCFVRDLARRYDADPDRLLTEMKSSAHHYESGAGHVHGVLYDTLTAAGAARAHEFDAYWADQLYLASVHCYDDNVAALAEVVRAHSGLTVVLANNEAEHWDELKNAHFGHYRHFDRLCSSWRMGQVKPSAEYFTTVLDHCEAQARESLMIDDRAEVIDVARTLGMSALHVRTPAMLRSQLLSTVEGSPRRSELADAGIDGHGVGSDVSRGI